MSVFTEVLGEMVNRLLNDPGVSALVGTRVFSLTPQDTALAYIKVKSRSDESDTKTTDGFRDIITIDMWTDDESLKGVDDIADAVYASMQNKPYTGLSLKSLCLQYQNYNTFIEPDNISTHGVMTFLHLYS